MRTQRNNQSGMDSFISASSCLSCMFLPPQVLQKPDLFWERGSLVSKRRDGVDAFQGTEINAVTEIQPIPPPVPHQKTGDNLDPRIVFARMVTVRTFEA